MANLRYNGKVDESGKLHLWGKEQMLRDVKSFAGKDIIMTIRERTKDMSKNQRGYWYAVVVKMIHAHFRESGYHYTLKQVDKMLVDMFFYEEHVNENTGTVFRIPLSMEIDGGITTKMFNEKKEEIQQWSASELDLYLPDPNEQINIDL